MWSGRFTSEEGKGEFLSNLLTGLAFLLSGAIVYWLNTEQHDPDREITFSRLLGFESIGAIETVAALLGMGMFFLGLGAFRWLSEQGFVAEEEGADDEPDSVEAAEDVSGELR